MQVNSQEQSSPKEEGLHSSSDLTPLATRHLESRMEALATVGLRLHELPEAKNKTGYMGVYYNPSSKLTKPYQVNLREPEPEPEPEQANQRKPYPTRRRRLAAGAGTCTWAALPPLRRLRCVWRKRRRGRGEPQQRRR